MDTQKLKAELVRDEGSRARPYADTRGVLTIGVGRNLIAKGLSPDEILYLYNNDVAEATGLLDKYVPWWRNLNDVRQRVMVNMTFNMGFAPERPAGERGFADFAKTLHYIETEQYEAASVEMMDSAWSKQVGPRAPRLAAMMKAGVD